MRGREGGRQSADTPHKSRRSPPYYIRSLFICVCSSSPHHSSLPPSLPPFLTLLRTTSGT